MPPTAAGVYAEVMEDYLQAHGLTEGQLSDALRWGIQTHHQNLQISPQGQLGYHLPKARRELRRAAFTLPSGKVMREWHHRTVTVTNAAGQPVQRDLWSDVDTLSKAPNGDGFILESLRQRCKAVKVDVKQIIKDRDGFNELRAALGLRTVQLRISYSYR